MTCCYFSPFKTLLMARKAKGLRYAVNVSDSYPRLNGRFWVTAEGLLKRVFDIEHCSNCGGSAWQES
jgi:hypothetical protein